MGALTFALGEDGMDGSTLSLFSIFLLKNILSISSILFCVGSELSGRCTLLERASGSHFTVGEQRWEFGSEDNCVYPSDVTTHNGEVSRPARFEKEPAEYDIAGLEKRHL